LHRAIGWAADEPLCQPPGEPRALTSSKRAPNSRSDRVAAGRIVAWQKVIAPCNRVGRRRYRENGGLGPERLQGGGGHVTVKAWGGREDESAVRRGRLHRAIVTSKQRAKNRVQATTLMGKSSAKRTRRAEESGKKPSCLSSWASVWSLVDYLDFRKERIASTRASCWSGRMTPFSKLTDTLPSAEAEN